MRTNGDVGDAVYMALYMALAQNTVWARASAVPWIVYKAVDRAVFGAVDTAVYRAVSRGPPHPALADFLAEVDQGAP